MTNKNESTHGREQYRLGFRNLIKKRTMRNYCALEFDKILLEGICQIK